MKEIVNEQPKASHCFDSRPCNIDSFQLTQSFVGTEVLFDEPHRISQIGLMNEIQKITNGIRFIYTLPLGPHRLLVEHTDFVTTPSDFSILKELNDRYLEQHFDVSRFQIIRTEAAHIPMGFKHQSINWGTPIGARGGMTRDATGYGYRTIRYACHSIAKDLVKFNSTKPFRQFKMTTWADQLFLNLIKQRPDVIPKTLMQIANKISPDKFAAFMMMRSPMILFTYFGCPCQVIYLRTLGEVSMDLSLILASCFISLVGLPHGALDPVVAHRCGLIYDLRTSLQFIAGYVIVVALVILLWLQLPAASLLLFLLISCVHFGRDWKQKFLSVALRMGRLFWDYRRGLLQNRLNRSLAS